MGKKDAGFSRFHPFFLLGKAGEERARLPLGKN